MGFSGGKIIFLAVLCQIVGVSVAQQPSLMSFGDFMEFFIGINEACKDIPNSQNVTMKIVNTFAECTYTVSPSPPTDEFENMEGICKNRQTYFRCWDRLGSDIKTTCGASSEDRLPKVYKATVGSFCGNDNGAKRIEELKKALQQITEKDQRECPEETGIHWLEQCENTIPQMNTPDVCKRHSTINNCLSKITCQNIQFAKLIQKVYSDGRQELRCN